MSEPKLAKDTEVVLTHCHKAWGLPTYDPRCLEIMLFLEHVCKVEWKAVESKYAYSPHSGCYPHLRVDNEVAGAEWYPDLLEKFTTDCKMEIPEMKKEDKVLASYVRKRLNLVNDFCFWRDEENKVIFGNVFKSKLSILPHFKGHLFNARRNEVDMALEKNNIRSREKAIEVLKECLTLLNDRLAASEYNTFYKDGCSELDCAVGAQLVVMKYHKLNVNYTDLEDSPSLEEYTQLSEFLKIFHAKTEQLNQGERIERNEVRRSVRRQRKDPAVKERSREALETDRKSRVFLVGCFLTVVAYCYIFKPVQIEVEPE